MHSRFLIADDSVLIGSTDLDTYGLTVHLNTSVYTKDQTTIEGLKLHFNKVWNSKESEEVALIKWEQ